MSVRYESREWFNSNGYGNWYGRAWKDGTAAVRDDLSSSEKAFVEYHEREHLKDYKKGKKRSEFRANSKALLRHPVGAAKLLFRAMKDGHKLDLPDGIDIDLEAKVTLFRW